MLKKILRRLTKSQQEKETWPSLVLLLKKHQPLSDDHLLQLADKTYGMPGTNGRISPELIGRTPDGYGRVLRIQFFFISVTEVNRKYEVAGQEASETRQHPWDEHAAWRSVDFPRQKAFNPEERNEVYKTLFFLIAQLWEENCLALYVPEEGLTIPNLGDWKESLVWAGKNGSSLDFLRAPLQSNPKKSNKGPHLLRRNSFLNPHSLPQHPLLHPSAHFIRSELRQARNRIRIPNREQQRA